MPVRDCICCLYGYKGSEVTPPLAKRKLPKPRMRRVSAFPTFQGQALESLTMLDMPCSAMGIDATLMMKSPSWI